jgi:N-methylhydantoinase A
MGIVLGIDVGGTFTDFLEIGGADGARVLKVPSIPAAPAEGVMNGLTLLAGGTASLAAYMAGVEMIVHGTTITTNAIITRRHAKTGYVTTKGFRDILNSRRGLKRNAFTAKEAPPEPIVPQYLVRTVDERLDKIGAVLQPLSEDDVREAAAHFRREGVEAVAVCTLFSFLNPAHEQRIKALLQEELPGVYVTASSEVLPQLRFYERGSTTVFNACVGPLLRGYIDRLLERLGETGFRGRFLTMQSNGGVMPPEAVKVSAASTLLSGPASAPVAGLLFAKPYQIPNFITVDMGGTSFDVCLIRDGRPAMTSQSEVAEYALALPALDIRAIGAGGGSIATLLGGLLEVGPASAGAAPGPACYGDGGVLPTVTDANLVLGYLNPDNFLGGKKKLHIAGAARAIENDIAKPLGLALAEAALGIVQVVDAKMADGVRAVSVARGFDPRDACLVAAGGAGPLHACGIADELGMMLILVPRASSVFCATGMLASDLRQDAVRHAAIGLSDGASAVAALNELREDLLRNGEDILSRQQVWPENRALEFSAEMLFEGQFNTIETRLPMLDQAPVMAADLPTMRAAFEAAHRQIYGYVLEGEPVEIRSLRLAAIGRTVPPRFPALAMATAPAEAALKGVRVAWFDGSPTQVAIYDGARFRAGHVVDGPVLVEHATTTIKIAPGWRACVDDIGNLLMWRREQTLDEAIARLQERRG